MRLMFNCLIFSFFTLTLQAQTDSGFNLGTRLGAAFSDMRIGTEPIPGYQQAGSGKAIGPAFNLFWSNALGRHFRLGMDIGFVSLEQDAIFKNNTNVDITNEYAGTIVQDKISIFIVPEYRFGDNNLAYVNAGLGFNRDLRSEWVDGTYKYISGTYNELRFLEGEPIGDRTLFGYTVGAGLCPNITDNMAFIFDIRYSGASSLYMESFGFTYSPVTISVGFAYKPRPVRN